MGAQKTTKLLRGKVMRATRLSATGAPLIGDSNAVSTEGFITVAYTTNTEEGEAINITNANGKSCITEAATPTFNGYAVEATFCNVDFALFNILTGQAVVVDPATQKIVGITESTDVRLDAVAFGLEVWTGASPSGDYSTGSQGEYGYILTPYLGGGVIGDITIENAAITFTVTGMSTRNGNSWGAGPYGVELTDGKPALLSTPMKTNDHRRIQTVEVAPPAVFAGSIPVLDPTSPALTSITAVGAAGKKATITPLPAGAGGVLYEFGDGSWDYRASGASYEHTYAAAGTYSVVAYRGLTKATANVVVPA